MRKYGRTDANHKAVVETCIELGASVQSLASIGDGCPDLLVGYEGRNILIEIKNGSKPPTKKMLTSDQAQWWGKWKGLRPRIVYSPEDVKVLFSVLFG